MKDGKKDLLMVCQFFYPEYVSSATLPFDTAQALVQAGYSVGALCGYPKEYSAEKCVPKQEIVDGVEIKRVKYVQKDRKGFFGRLINYFCFFCGDAVQTAGSQKYRTIMVYSNPPIQPLWGVLAKKLYGCKLIFVSYDVYPEIAIRSGATSEDGMIAGFLRRVNRSVFKHADRVVALSEDMKGFLEANRGVSANCRILNIPNWYEDLGELPKMNPKQNQLFSHIEEDCFVVSYLGNLGTCQDETTLLQAIRSLKNCDKIRFVFAGHGNKMSLIKQAVIEEKLANVTCFDFLRGDDYQTVLAISDCFVVSLVDGMLGLCSPSKAYAYMMRGRPVACIMHPESELARDIDIHQAGKCFNVGDGNALAEFFKELKNDPALCREMGQNCRKVYVDKYEKKKCLQKYVEMIKEMHTKDIQ